MTFINTCADVDDLGGGRFRHTQYIKPVAYDDNGTLRAIASAFTASGIAGRPHTVRAARLMTSVADDGMRRIHPTREADRYVEIGTPYIKVGGVWRKMGFRGGMRMANRLNWASPQANMSIVHAGHYVKLEIELRRGYVPEDNLIAFPVGLNGLKRSGANILSDGKTVMHLREPQMYDAANEMDTRAIDGKFVSLAGQPYYLMTLPSLAGMSRPVIDPTLALQPDGSSGHDTTMISWDGGVRNYGATTTFSLMAGTALIKFDITSIPPLAVLTSATLSLYVIYVGGAGGISTFTLYRMLQGNTWIEGTKNNATAGAGEPCWNAREADGSGGVMSAWLGSAGAATADVDYASTPIGTFQTYTDLGSVDIPLLLSAVTGWHSQAETNEGIRWRRTSSSTRDATFAHSEYGTAAYRPKLTVEYTLPGGGNIFQSAILHSSLYGKTLVR